MYESDWNDDMENFEPVVQAEVEFIAAMESLDVDKIMGCWSESDRAIMVFPGVDISCGEGAIRLSWEQISSSISKLQIILKPISVQRLGDIGWTFLAGTMMSTHADETLSIEVYATNIYVRESDGWKIIHLHMTPAPHQPSYLEQRLN